MNELQFTRVFHYFFIALIDLITRSSTPAPKSTTLLGVWDFKKWMEPYNLGLQNHSKYLHYRYTLDASGHAELHYRKFTGEPWEPEKEGLRVLSVCTGALCFNHTCMQTECV